MVTLDCTKHNAFYQVLLDKRVQTQDRQCSHEHCGVLYGSRCRCPAQRKHSLLLLRRHTGFRQKLVEDRLQRFQRLIPYINNALVIIVPVVDRCKQSNRCNDRLGIWHDNFPINREFRCAIQPGTLHQRFRNRAEEAHENDHVVEGKHSGEDIHPECVVQLELDHQNKVGDQTAVKKHGDHCDLHVELFPDQVLPGHAVGDHGGEKDVRKCGNNSTKNCDFETAEDVFILKDNLIGIQAQSLWPPCNRPPVRNFRCCQ